MKTQKLAGLERLLYPARTTFAAMVALLAARAVGLPESYWAPVSAVIVVQSDFGSSLLLSWHRLVGTALGVSVAAVLAGNLGRGVIVYAVGIFGAGLLAVGLRLGRPAIRFAGIAFSIVFLIVRQEPAWVVAWHRFVEVSTGIFVGLVLSAIWPEPKTIDSSTYPTETHPPMKENDPRL